MTSSVGKRRSIFAALVLVSLRVNSACRPAGSAKCDDERADLLDGFETGGDSFDHLRGVESVAERGTLADAESLDQGAGRPLAG